MSLAERYISLKGKTEEFVTTIKNSDFLSQKKDIPLSYAYPCNNYISSILSNVLVRKSLQAFTDKYCTEQIENIKSSSLLVTKNNYPRCYDVLQSCYKSLNIEDFPEVYITNRLRGINALSVGTDSSSIILVSCKAVISLSEGELKFMIGHELGHIIQKNLECHTAKGLLDNLNNKSEILGPIVSDMIEVPLNQWCRANEYTADRAGYLCCKNMESVYSLFSKIGNDNTKTVYSNYMEIYREHPYIKDRIDRINEFKDSIN